jgi:hypothetical protein
MNTKKIGDIGLGAAIAFFTSKGFTVCLPLTDSQDYDLIIDIGTNLNRCQVKYTSFKRYSKSYIINVTVKGGNRTSLKQKIKKLNPEKVDSVFVCTPNKLYWIPVSALEGKSCITLSEKYEQFIVSAHPSI